MKCVSSLKFPNNDLKMTKKGLKSDLKKFEILNSVDMTVDFEVMIIRMVAMETLRQLERRDSWVHNIYLVRELR